MSTGKSKARVMRSVQERNHEPLLWRLPLDREWLDMAPVGREFGSKDYERLNILDMLTRGEMSEQDAMTRLNLDHAGLAAMLRRDGLPHGGGRPAKTTMRMHEPPHPGAVLREYLGDSTISSAARCLGVHRATLSRIVNGSAGISAEMSLRLAAAFGCEPDFWAGLQLKYDLFQARLLVGPSIVKTVHPHRRKR